MNNTFETVYSNYTYILIAIGIFFLLFFPLITISEFLFFEPFIVFSIYPETTLSFLLIVILSFFSALAVSMNIYRVKLIKKTKKIGSSIIGTIIGASAGACSCGPIAFSIITTFGTAGSIASSFLNVYEIPIRLTSIGILGIVIFVTTKSLSRECKINL
ncbi:MAG: hypothetical protein HOC53_03065 [Candidatus Nitrosopelagicus sp.]|nr:hypothetical protein [Candidatus Nitrosopelagicus sp.]MBT4327910.1 hypothetical protein [Candidatus Nitrosopelagicus sp.]MBT4454916.1 hypothetical protein [Candidatus Nitrosopelagicus sp.]MBT5171887.1 hypothetical protein [Candidatus Nitrosopelagicus sp.]MBT6647136.1 hypothetical protein [Nitrososphaerota archaeon]